MTADELAAAPHYVYRLRDAEGVLLYVGCAVDPAKRLRESPRNRPERKCPATGPAVTGRGQAT